MKSKDQFWMVYGEGQRAPAYVHATFDAAETEARRLARSHPGLRFFVLAAVRGFMIADPVVEVHINVTDDSGIPF